MFALFAVYTCCGRKKNESHKFESYVLFRICSFSVEWFCVICLSLCLLCSWQEHGDFGVALSEVLAAWKYFLLDKLQLSHNDIPLPQNYDLIRKEYGCFLKRTNTVDLIDVFIMFKELRIDEDPEEPLTSVSAASGPQIWLFYSHLSPRSLICGMFLVLSRCNCFIFLLVRRRVWRKWILYLCVPQLHLTRQSVVHR